MAAKAKSGSGRNRRLAGRPPSRSGWFGYALFLLLLLGVWIRITHQGWWDRGQSEVRNVFGWDKAHRAPALATRDTSVPVGGCGGARARLAVLDDAAGAALARQTPKPVTIEQLAALARPAAVNGDARAAAESQNYQVEAVLVGYRESGPDLVLLLGAADNPRLRLTATIPAGRCTVDADRGALFDELREDVVLRFGPAGQNFSELVAPPRVAVTGVGFFDPQPAAGGAGNGFELRPVLDVRVE